MLSLREIYRDLHMRAGMTVELHPPHLAGCEEYERQYGRPSTDDAHTTLRRHTIGRILLVSRAIVRQSMHIASSGLASLLAAHAGWFPESSLPLSPFARILQAFESACPTRIGCDEAMAPEA